MAYPPYSIEDKKCARKGCRKTYTPHHWGTKAACRAGWFLQRNGTAWCPDHIPDWVTEWRKRQQEKKEKDK